jgi:hypothetical protein
LEKDTFDPNAMFGNPNKGIVKMIEVNLECQGHDSERRTDNREITSDANSRNFITTKNARLTVVVRDDPVSGRNSCHKSRHSTLQLNGIFVRCRKRNSD